MKNKVAKEGSGFCLQESDSNARPGLMCANLSVLPFLPLRVSELVVAMVRYQDEGEVTQLWEC